MHMSQSTSDTARQLQQLVTDVGQHLNADRCFLHIRKPEQGLGRIAYCWRRDESIPDAIRAEWEEDARTLPDIDPLFRAALLTQPSVYVDDVETAPATVLNRDFEAQTFGHRALVHAHVVEGDTLWGILQPCMFGQPRHWTDADRAYIDSQLPQLLALLKEEWKGEKEGPKQAGSE